MAADDDGPTTIPALLAVTAARHGDRPALDLADGRVLDHAALAAGVTRAGAWLTRHGLTRGDRVALQLDKGLAFVLLHLACLGRGLVSVPVNPRATERERDALLADCGAALHVTGLPADHDFADAPDGPPAAPPAPDELACLVYTSGTTGRPKGVRLLHRHLAANTRALVEAWRVTADDRLLHVLPVFHVHGLFVALTTTLVAGGRVSFAAFEPAATWDALRSGGLTVFMAVPTLYHRLVEHAVAHGLDARLPDALRLCTSGSAPLRPDVAEAFQALTGRRLLERYGMTEVGMAASQPYDGPRKEGSVGPALPGVGLRVVGPEGGAPLPAGTRGEVQITGHSVCDGYWDRPEATAALFTADGWLRSGDLGHLDADGHLHLAGRLKELVISGGFNITPREVEAVLETHPDIAEVAVCGLPDPDLGEVVAAGVVPRPGTAPEAEALRDWAREKLSAYKLPRRVLVLDELPRTPLGKVQKAELAKLFGGGNGSGDGDGGRGSGGG